MSIENDWYICILVESNISKKKLDMKDFNIIQKSILVQKIICV